MKMMVGGMAVLAVAAGLAMGSSAEARTRYNGQDPATMPSRAGAPAARQYRRMMHRYRYNPGAQQELRTNRQGFCQFAPSRC